MSTGTETFYRHAGEIAQDLDSAIIASLSASPPACGREEALELESFATGEVLSPVIRMFRTGLKSVHVAGIAGDVGRDAVLLSLARSLAETGRRILVVDADGDGPPLAQTGRPGLTDVLTGQVSLTNVILPSPGYEGMMAFLPIGTQPASLETPGAVEPLVRTLDDIRPSYDVTLVSGPCLDRRGKVHPAATACEAVVLVLSPGIVSRDRIRRNFLQLWGVEAPIRGLITLGVPDVVAEVIPEEEADGAVVHDTTPEVVTAGASIAPEPPEPEGEIESPTPAAPEPPDPVESEGLELVGVSEPTGEENGAAGSEEGAEEPGDRDPVLAREAQRGDPPIISLEPTEPEAEAEAEPEACEFEDGIHQEHRPLPLSADGETEETDPPDEVMAPDEIHETTTPAGAEIPDDESPAREPDETPPDEPAPEPQLTFLQESEGDEMAAESDWEKLLPEESEDTRPTQPAETIELTEEEVIASLVEDSGPPPEAFPTGGISASARNDAEDLEAVERQARALASDRAPRGGSGSESGFRMNPVTMGVGALVVIAAAVIMFWLLPRMVGGDDDVLEGLAGTTELTLEGTSSIPEESVVTKEQLTEETTAEGSGPGSAEESGASRPTSATIDQSPPPPADPPSTPTSGTAPTSPTPLEVPDGISTLMSERFRGVSPFFAVHITSFRKPEGAAIDAERLEKVTGYTTDYIDTEVVKSGQSTGEWYRVIVGRFQDPDDAARAARAFREKGITDYARVYYITGP